VVRRLVDRDLEDKIPALHGRGVADMQRGHGVVVQDGARGIGLGSEILMRVGKKVDADALRAFDAGVIGHRQ
jgi:hypothetical protein